MKKNKIPTYKEDLINRLKNLRYAEGYLNASLEDEDPRVFLLALRDVAEAQGGLSKFSKITQISREHAYRMLSEKGNPGLFTIKNLLNAAGLKFSIEIKEQDKKAA
ncbi:MAG: transcriptional regulator [Candidatus Omnitrophica bacterium]|nr:transcriptional regulator [Candidatus Omnitrophota bacterium]